MIRDVLTSQLACRAYCKSTVMDLYAVHRRVTFVTRPLLLEPLSLEPGRICMISMYLQTAPSRSVLMLDAGAAR
jgi:hypothetical protein